MRQSKTFTHFEMWLNDHLVVCCGLFVSGAAFRDQFLPVGNINSSLRYFSQSNTKERSKQWQTPFLKLLEWLLNNIEYNGRTENYVTLFDNLSRWSQGQTF